jgi:hypothetical protein
LNGKIRIYGWCAGLALILSTGSIDAQLLKDTATLNIVKKDIGYIYNLQFSEARELYTKIVTAYPEHPVVYLLSGMITYWENFPLMSTSPARVSFEADLRECIKIAEKRSTAEHEAEYLLGNLWARGFLLQFYSDNDLVMQVIPLATSSYKYLMRSFDFTLACSDLYYFTGVYNYYRDAYPKIYPAYKPLLFVFPPGNMQTGITQLNFAANNAIVLGAESSYLLTYIYINFENDYFQGYRYARYLHETYPDNPQYLAAYLKNLLLLKRYDDVEKLIDKVPSISINKYLLAQIMIFRGLVQEKKYLDNKSARQYYNNGISTLSLYGEYANEYVAYGYFGLSRISEASGDKNGSQKYRKEALKLADFKKIDFEN